jgi:hypothetical protein
MKKTNIHEAQFSKVNYFQNFENHQSLNWKENISFIFMFGIVFISISIGFCSIIGWTFNKLCAIF